MEDREIVAAIAAGELAALARAYDQYAESLYGYCRWLLAEPADAADAAADTFVIAAGKLGGLGDPRKLRPWLYAVARNECHRRLPAAELGLDEEAGLADSPAAVNDDAERAELRRLVRSVLAGLNPGEREAVELSLRHDLHGADLAAVLGISRNQAHALVARARGQLEETLGAMFVARTGRRACRGLDTLLAGVDGRLPPSTRKRINEHADQCEICGNRRRGAVRTATLLAMAPLAALPYSLRDDVLELCSDSSDPTLAYRQEVMLRAGPFGPDGFPPAIRQPRPRTVVLARIAAAAGVATAVVATGTITVLALSGPHVPHSVDAVRVTSGAVTASAAQTAGATASAAAPASASPTSSQPTTAAQAPMEVPATSASKAEPSPSHPATTPATAKPSTPSPSPTPTGTTTATPTGTPTATATATPTATATSTATSTP
ncbi:MAG TPA: sigma-70 family RNA polymerase sigma factor [Streptosporangiaceae bacterium]|nr:sigma-70 family RNA polymerase sigma factor [Streptosporangiaceae bacterium]